MSFVDRVNRMVMRIIRRKRGELTGPIVCDGEGVQLRNGGAVIWTIPWRDVQRVTAFKYPSYIGDYTMLALECENVDSRLLSEDMSGWREMLAELPTHLRGARRFEEWCLDLARAADDTTITVYVKPASF